MKATSSGQSVAQKQVFNTKYLQMQGLEIQINKVIILLIVQ